MCVRAHTQTCKQMFRSMADADSGACRHTHTHTHIRCIPTHLQRGLPCVRDGLAHGERVVAVDAQRPQAVRPRAPGDAVATELLGGGRADGMRARVCARVCKYPCVSR